MTDALTDSLRLVHELEERIRHVVYLNSVQASRILDLESRLRAQGHEIAELKKQLNERSKA